MPWFKVTPTDEQILIGYLQQGGSLPRQHDPPSGQQWGYNFDPANQLFNAIKNWQSWSRPANDPDPICDRTKGMTGVALLALFEKWPKTIALAWLHSTVWNQLNYTGADATDYVVPDVWINVARPILVDRTSANIMISSVLDPTAPGPPPDNYYLDLRVPMPQIPDLNPQVDIYEELLIGHATNPMYTGCY